jgi:hypothetical protein
MPRSGSPPERARPAVDPKLARRGLCGTIDLPSGNRCVRRAGHRGPCHFAVQTTRTAQPKTATTPGRHLVDINLAAHGRCGAIHGLHLGRCYLPAGHPGPCRFSDVYQVSSQLPFADGSGDHVRRSAGPAAGAGARSRRP